MREATAGARGGAAAGETASEARFDVEAVREDFPILHRAVHDRRLIYLDSAATSQKPLAVIEAMDRYYRMHNANVHRGAHRLSEEATTLYERARAHVARFIGAAEPAEVVFTRGTTEAINLVANAWGGANLRAGDAILVTEMEHHANLVPWQMLAERVGAEIRAIPIDDDGRLELGALDRLLDRRVKLLAFTQVSNVLGTHNPVAELVAAARAVGALTLLDAAQSVPHMPVDAAALGVDFLVFSAHKMCGPTGIGALWGRRALLEAMPPWQGGGEMIGRVTIQRSTWAGLPQKFEAGTPAIAEAVGLAAAIDYLHGIGMPAIQAHERRLTRYAIERLSELPGLRIHGPLEDRGGALAFSMEGIHPHDLSTILDRQGVAIRAGHHCAMPLHERLGLPASARASFYLYNTESEVDALSRALLQSREIFGLA
ncbi:MAG: cysteine desulfurase [Caldilineae bacterium]|nr:cysteine desulfurase [Caldilineae bacterium]